ncbi:MAG TPA: hypothetical protein VK489_05820 [Ferruginibacter sp.]|nr:hypothetical protein [Ferruginibacter sp.]
MAKVVIGAEVKVAGLDQAGQSVGNFKKQLKEATNDLLLMSQKFGDTSKQAQEAAKKVAGLRDAIGDAKALTETFNPDKKFVALGGALQGTVAGFSALTGVMGLFGAQSKETEALLLKVQSAMALQQGLAGIKGSIDSFKLLGTAIQASSAFQKANNIVTTIAVGIQRLFGVSVVQTGTAFNVLKGAIIATGIGALVVLIGTAVSQLNLFGDASQDAAADQDKLTESINKQKQALEEAMHSNQQYVDRLIDIVKNNERIADLQAMGAGHEKEIADLRKKNIAIELENVRVELITKKGLLTTQEELTLKTKEYTLQKQFERIDIELATKATENNNKEKQKAIEKAAKEAAVLKELNEYKAGKRAEEKAAIEAYGTELAAQDKAEGDATIKQLKDNKLAELQAKKDLADLALLEDPNSIVNKLAANQTNFDLEMEQFEGNNVQRQIKEKEHSDAKIKILDEEKVAKKKISDEDKAEREQNLAHYASLLDNLADVVGKHTVAGKALAIASTVIQTYQGATAALTSFSTVPIVGTALGFVAAAAVVASGLKSIQKIASVKVPGKGGGGGAPSISGLGAPNLPNAPLTPRPQTTTLDQQSINGINNAANRAYVLETDVSGNQERIRKLNRAARIN